MGKFNECTHYPCSMCGINGYSKECEECNGESDEEGLLIEIVPVSWTTIKEIYKMIVKNMEVK